MTGPTTIAVVLNYRTARDTIAAVRSLSSSTAPLATIVVDNASGDGLADMLTRELPDVELIVAPTNGGFSAECNLGIREALRRGAERVLLLNSDVTVPPATVGELERVLDLDPVLGIVGPILVSRADPQRIESLGMRYAFSSGRMRHDGFDTRRDGVPPFERYDVDGVSGCAMMITRKVFERIGLLTEKYFFGFEDLDFCLRARAVGFRTACVGTATVLHQGSASMGRRSPRRIYFATRNQLLLARRCSPLRSHAARWLQTMSILGLNLAAVLLTAEVPRLAGLRAFVKGARDHLAGRYGPGPLGGG